MDFQLALLSAVLMEIVSAQVRTPEPFRGVLAPNLFRSDINIVLPPSTQAPVARAPRPRNRFRDPNRCRRRQRRLGLCVDGVTPSPRVTRRRTPRPPTLPPTPPRPTEQASPTEQPPQPAVGVQLGSINEIRAEIRRFIERDHERIPNMLQLVFHTCIGGCDGCLNFDEPGNSGLRETYADVRRMWESTASDVLSLADMIVLMSIEATDIGMQKEEGPGSFPINFRTGRTTCPDPDNYTEQFNFPHGGSRSDIATLQREFGLSRKHTVALMGAHSVGRCRRENSGFAGRWDNTELTLDNHYYRSITGTDWISTSINGQIQWNSTRGANARMMLHSDLAMMKEFTLDVRGKPSCTRAKSCRDSDDSVHVKQYARNDQIWAQDFVDAFEIMINKGLPRA